MAPPSSNTAQVVRENSSGPTLSLESIPLPEVGPVKALVKVDHVAQNPTDVQSFDSNVFGDGAVLGCDFTGTVERVGSGVSRLKEGDHVAGLIWGGEIKGAGAYSQYTIADERICFKIPDGVSPEQVATIPLAAATSWLAMFSSQCLNIPRQSGEKQKILVWGGSSSVGQFAIQEAALSNIEVVTTCSPKHFDFVKGLGASHVFDYRSENIVEEIKSAVPDLTYVFDTIGNKESSGIASKAVAKSGGVLCTVRPGKANTESVITGVRVTDVLVWTSFLKEHRYGKFHWPASEEDHGLSTELFEKLPGWLQSGKFKPNQAHVLEGLESVNKGFQMHRDGKISGFKIVYKL